MSLTRKIGAYLCTAAMVFSLNFKSDALVKEILQFPGIIFEAWLAGTTLAEVRKSKVDKDNDNDKVKVNNTEWDVYKIIFGSIFSFDSIQRTYFITKEMRDNKELNKKNEKNEKKSSV